MAELFATDEQIVAQLSKPVSLDWACCFLGVARSRAKTLLQKHKAQILKSRIEVHHQHINSICFHLDLLEHFSAMKDWYSTQYGDSHEHRSNGAHEKLVSDQG